MHGLKCMQVSNGLTCMQVHLCGWIYIYIYIRDTCVRICFKFIYVAAKFHVLGLNSSICNKCIYIYTSARMWMRRDVASCMKSIECQYYHTHMRKCTCTYMYVRTWSMFDVVTHTHTFKRMYVRQWTQATYLNALIINTYIPLMTKEVCWVRWSLSIKLPSANCRCIDCVSSKTRLWSTVHYRRFHQP